MQIKFSEADRERIREAVEGAERHTSGEIVPYVVDRCDSYEVAVWRGAALCGLIVLAALLLFLRFYEGWGYAWLHSAWAPLVILLFGVAVGALATWAVPSIRRRMAGPSRLTSAVHGRAMRAFIEEEVFKTRDRTGILIFISLFEHRIEVLGDEGINRAVSADDWIDVVQTIQQGIRERRVTDGIVEAIRKCGALLTDHGLEIQPDDTDELSNRLRIQSDD